ncbi:uncharacterized protein LOC131155971 [Malania oleifera]|uniref:uncharacterized protein LOC131155971 n=1 Tax=Malania oleifera TaxID=397392 RepID=UPI0025AE0A00|nr:uncharacterized protein LOC131155971 [Malania oleifera]
MSKILELLTNKRKAVQNDPEIDMDPAHPLGFTPVRGQTSAPLPGVMEGSMPSIPPFIPNIPAQGFPVVGTPPLVASDLGMNRSETERRYEVLEERLKAIEGSNTFDSVDPNDLCLVPKIVHTGGRPQIVPSGTMPTQPNVRTHDRGIQRNTRRIDPIPMTYSELFPQLMERNLVSVIPGMVITAPFPQWYDPEAKCAYHANTPGHTIEWCWAFKNKVQTLREAGWLAFDDKQPRIQGNPLPNHGGNNVEMIEEGTNEVDFEQMSLDWVFNELIAVGRIGQEAICPTNALCLCQSKEGRSVKQCVTFRMFLQKMVDNKFIEIGCTRKTGEIAVIGENRPEAPARLVISTPRPFPYKSNQAVPWKYECEAYVEGSTSNIAGLKGITRSGRVYMPDSFKANRQNAGEPDRAVRSPISNGEAEEFLKIIKHSEYNIVDQLKKMPAHISVLSLLLNSETHREALLKVLNQAYIPQDISVDKFNHVIGSLAASNYITFTDEEIPPEGQGHNKALHISTKCKDHMMSRVLIDNGSSLNVMPMTTLQRLPIDPSYVTPNNLVVRAFDGTRRESVGSLDIPIQIGPVTFNITFQVMDITPS